MNINYFFKFDPKQNQTFEKIPKILLNHKNPNYMSFLPKITIKITIVLIWDGIKCCFQYASIKFGKILILDMQAFFIVGYKCITIKLYSLVYKIMKFHKNVCIFFHLENYVHNALFALELF